MSQTISNALFGAIGISAIAYCLAAIGLNVHFGYTGLLNFGQAGFALVGGYAVAMPISNWGWSLWATIPVVIVSSAVFALLLGIPTLRLRSDYLAIVTIAAAEILRLLVSTPKWVNVTGSTDGINSFTNDIQNTIPGFLDEGFSLWKVQVSPYIAWVMVLGWLLVGLFSVLVWSLMRSPWGRVLRSIREDEDAARSLGKNVFAYKMTSLVLGGVIGAFGGAILVIGQRSAAPTSFQTQFTFLTYAIVVLGGIGRVKGPIIGAMIFWFIISFSDSLLADWTDGSGFNLPSWIMDSSNFSFFRWIIVGGGLALLVIFRPQGIFGDRKEQSFDVR
ncbi:MAG TPA: branched-chain amino acid ABC transporter permease [Acidimicrobiaceae bacterium]|nr:branched-chain amino acid ABC transporter permease [Acidimicrobiaceae bacterium]